jgi:cyclophilin family peptidyl-prolyl cis-trans isomerase
MPAANDYAVKAIYDNTTGEVQDSMVTLGLFLQDFAFRKPDWSMGNMTVASNPVQAASYKSGAGNQSQACDLYCGVKPSNQDSGMASSGAQARASDASTTPLKDYEKYIEFDPKRDGPILSEPQKVSLKTSAGDLHIVLDPTVAPQTATQMYKLFKAGAFDYTPFFRYEPGFLVQASMAETKADNEELSPTLKSMLRRLPLEISLKKSGLHKKYALTMGRWDEAPDSAVSSFSILLGDAPHLDHCYTVFGYLVPDKVSLATISAMQLNWSKEKPKILRTEVPGAAAIALAK